MTDRIREFLARTPDEGPRLVVDLEIVRENFHSFAKALPDTRVFYAVKANPAPEVVPISQKSDADAHRWVYLDIGKFNGLAETMDEMIRYPIRTAFDDDEIGPCVLAGPSCDSVDVL